MNNNLAYCERCYNTGVINASTVKNEATWENEKILVKVCPNHKDYVLAEATMTEMSKTSDLSIDIDA
jgi:hypothetical protein